MSLSTFASQVILKALEESGQVSVDSKNVVTFKATLGDTRREQSISEFVFTFKKPVTQDYIEQHTSRIFDILNDNLDASTIGLIDNVLAKANLIKYIGKTAAYGRVAVDTPGFEDDSESLGDGTFTNSIRTKSGRFMSLANFKSVLEVLMKKNMMDIMTGGGPELQNRTGRFIVTSNIGSILLTNSSVGIKKYNLDIKFGYKESPYSVFDPATSGSPLANNSRNPRNIIGEALYTALSDLLNLELFNLRVVKGN